MVFYLEIQSTYKPTYQLISGSEIGSGFQLMNSPLVFHSARAFVGLGEMCMLHCMCQLENNAQHKAREEAINQEANQSGSESNRINRQENKETQVQYFE